MSTVMKELKAEISRLARHEIKKELTPVRRINAAQRGLIASLRRQVATMQKELKTVQKDVSVAGAATAALSAAGPEAATRFWITGKGVKTLRKRLGLTQTELGRLAGVSIATVVNWESTQGKVAIRRKATIDQLREVRTLTKRAAAAKLEKPAKAAKLKKPAKA